MNLNPTLNILKQRTIFKGNPIQDIKSKIDTTTKPDTFEKSEIVHDISNGQESYKIRHKFCQTGEEITFILPKNPNVQENNKTDKKGWDEITFALKNIYGEGAASDRLREFNNFGVGEGTMARYQKFAKEILDDFKNGIVTADVDYCDPMIRVLFSRPNFEKLSSISQKVMKNCYYMGEPIEIQKLDKGVRNEIENYLKNVKDNFPDLYKKVLLDDVNRLYEKIDKCTSPLQNNWHVYRGLTNSNPQYTKFLSELKVGETATIDNGMLFTAADPRQALQYTWEDGTLLHFVIPKGAKMCQPNGTSESYLPPMAKFKVLGSKRIGKDGFRVIDLEYLTDQGTRSL